MIIFGICSAINGYNKGVYSTQERFEQTINTINSIRKLNHNSYIIICDNSNLQKEYRDVLAEIVDEFLSFDNTINDKSKCEAHQMIEIIKRLDNLQYEVFFKISGRYYLTDSYNINQYKNDKINFRPFNNNCYSTVLYSFTKEHELLMKDSLTYFITSSHFTDIEHGLFNLLNHVVNNVEYLGVAGNIAPSGEYLEH